MSRLLPAAAGLVLAALLGGCVTAPRETYAWGSYEELVYVATTKPGSVPPEAQIETMEKEREVNRAKSQRFPPGWHAHLAYLYSVAGKPDLAADELLAEKTAFPEATVFCDQLLTNLGATAAKAKATASEATESKP